MNNIAIIIIHVEIRSIPVLTITTVPLVTIEINSSCKPFKVTFTSADGKTVKKYIGTDLVVDNSLRETNLKKGSSVSGNVTVSDLPSLAKGDVVLLTYTPDPVYAEYSVNWKFVTVE